MYGADKDCLGILGEQRGDIPIKFANGTYDLIYYSYSRSRFTYPYFIVSIVLCVAVFLSGILIFVGRMMKRVSTVKGSIVRMSVGDLSTPVPPCGGDELGIVAGELDTLRQTLRENCDFIRIAGFTVSEDNRWEEKNSIQQKFQSPDHTAETMVYGDEILIKRIFSNLFSNILKYGDKRDTVSVKLYPERGSLRISIQNRIRENAAETESTRIGLRSARRMVELHHGELYTFVDTNIYHVCITFNMIHKSSACSV